MNKESDEKNNSLLQSIKEHYTANPWEHSQAIWIYRNLPEIFQRAGFADFSKRAICFDLVSFWKQSLLGKFSLAPYSLQNYSDRHDPKLPEAFRIKLETLAENFHAYPLSYSDLKFGEFYEAFTVREKQKYLTYLVPDELEGINIGGVYSTVRFVENNQSCPYIDMLIYRRYA